MRISYDLRFAHLPCGSLPYVSNVIRILVRRHPETSWRIYHNTWSAPQQEIVRLLQRDQDNQTEKGRIDYRPVRFGCLSLRHHLEFLRYHDDADLYHYLHFDLPLGMRKIPVVVTIHDLYPLVLPGYCSAVKRGCFKFIAQRNARRATRVITVSKNTKKDIIEHLDIPAEKVIVINQGYSPEFHPIDDDEFLNGIRGKYDLPVKFILYTGNHKSHKNLARLLEAYERLPGKLRKAFPIVLTGPITAETQKLTEQAHNLNIDKQVKFIGMIPGDDLPALNNLASILVLPSVYEGFGIPLVEAMACGTPVLCSNAGAMPDVVADAGQLFDPYDIEQISQTLKEALENDVDNPVVRQSCLGRAEMFSWEKTAQQTYQLYESIAG